MSESTAEPPPEIDTWTKEDVHLWLMTEVKVHQTCADRFIEEEVSGENVYDFEKKDILELGIKHGPAVKITSYLEKLKEGSQHESQLQACVENWTKEEVNKWLLQHVKVDVKKAERLLEEDVSGDCLVCFKKQDFLDLQLKSGPAVKILKELDRLKNKPDLTLNPVRRTSLISRLRLSFTRKRQEKESQKTDLPPENKEEKTTNPAPIIKNTLDKLGSKDLKSFHFELSHYTDSEYKPIPWGKLEDKDTMDIYAT
ncbi:sterile alpha motif domain-containing protein 9-like [Thunnus albacares]|uniref:sterile alpha motif domain-containing protein 9-like n=1 Tax=Thunnus albacares TaxID=8236 RepID=UPI001CF60854|nr:sterile alpha motif domain-containing protein 9-like [Thunnus albacares]